MKVRITLKDPDGCYDAITDAAERSVSEVSGLGVYEVEELIDSRRRSLHEACAKWVNDSEYVTIEIDTDAKTAVVIPV